MSNRNKESEITVAVAQMEPKFGATELNVMRSIELMEMAAARGANLIVMPELCNTGYVFETRSEARSLAEPVPDGPSTEAWCRAANRLGVHLVAGIAESDGETLYNSAVVIGPDGLIGRYRKMHLWNAEALYFTPGNLGFPVFDTALGRIGCLICYDCWFPEAFRLSALQGAEIVCVPTNWVPVQGQDPNSHAMANILVMAAAHSNSIFVAAADRVGIERGQKFIGQSLVVGHSGWPLAGPASEDREELMVTKINLADARRGRTLNGFNQILRDRRIDAYAEMLGSNRPAGWY